MNYRKIFILTYILLQISNAHAQSKSEAEIDLPESPRERVIYVGGNLGVPYGLNSNATSGGNAAGLALGASAGVIALDRVYLGAFFNQSFTMGSNSLIRPGTRGGIEAEYLLPAFENWSVGLGYRAGVVQILGITPMFPDGYENSSIGHGPKLTLLRKLSNALMLGVELSYFTFNNPQFNNQTLFGPSAGPGIASAATLDANLSLRFLL